MVFTSPSYVLHHFPQCFENTVLASVIADRVCMNSCDRLYVHLCEGLLAYLADASSPLEAYLILKVIGSSCQVRNIYSEFYTVHRPIYCIILVYFKCDNCIY